MERRGLLYSSGNLKIGADTMIINMGSAKRCPAGKAGLCPLFKNKKCYAMKAERMYKQVLPYRHAQAAYWQKYSAYEITRDIVAELSRRRRPIKFLRFNEAGDFYGQGCVWKASNIADALKPYNIKVYTYTHRKDLDFSGLSDNFTVNGSGFMIHNNFSTVLEYSGRIRCGNDCRVCNMCKERRGIKIEVLQH